MGDALGEWQPVGELSFSGDNFDWHFSHPFFPTQPAREIWVRQWVNYRSGSRGDRILPFSLNIEGLIST